MTTQGVKSYITDQLIHDERQRPAQGDCCDDFFSGVKMELPKYRLEKASPYNQAQLEIQHCIGDLHFRCVVAESNGRLDSWLV